VPKVSKEYLENKKELFLQAALVVCKTKPLYEVTMKDIIRECKISQGGIYRYYSDVDEILVEVINWCNPNADYRQKIDDIVENSRTPKEAVENLFSFMGNYMQSNVTTIGKILFELTVLMANHPSRGRKIQSQIKDGQSGQYFITRMSQVARDGIASGYFHPVLPEDNILSFISMAIDGIAVNGALLKSYGVPQRGEIPFDVLHLMDTFKTSVLLMLNPDDEEGGKLSYE
jgi:AcrR family transcriptional regulator